MLDRLRVKVAPQESPPRPQKIKPVVTVRDFRKFTPRVVAPIVLPQAMPRAVLKPLQQRSRPPDLQQPKVPQTQTRIISKGALPQVVSAPPRSIQVQPPPPPPSRPVNSPRGGRPTIIKVQYPAKSYTSSINSLKGVGAGRVLVMIAAGPSINEVDFSKINGNPQIDFMCINQPCQKVWPSKFWAFCDHSQYRRNTEIWDHYTGIIVNSSNVRARKANQHIVSTKAGKGFSFDIGTGYYIGRSSTYANMQVAHYMGYKKVFIFGCDMGASPSGLLHYYGQNPDVTNDVRVQRFADEAEHYMWAARNLSEEIRSKFVFCTAWNKWPFIQHFPNMDHLKAVDGILEYLKSAQT